MARFFETGKGKKRLITALSILLSATLSLGIMTACNNTSEPDEDEDKTTSAVDTQLLKNGNFEFYSEMDEEDRNERKAFINSPNNWSFSSGSPSSDTTSGIVNTEDWAYMSTSSYKLIPAEKEDDPELTSSVISNAKAHWDEASLYDRLEFYDYYGIDSSSEFELYGDYRYTIDFEDVEYLHEVASGEDNPLLRPLGEDETREEVGSSVLMIHNKRTSDGVRGTAQYYTSSTTITLSAGTSAKLSVWVRTSELYHYAASTDGTDDIAVTAKAGAYIGITNTVGGTTLDQMQIKNINTQDEWQQYTVYIRANTFATTTFRVVLGLGQGSSDNRYEAVDGYAFFDDVQCEVIPNEDFSAAVTDANYNEGKNLANLDSKGKDKIFYATEDTPKDGKPVQKDVYNYALDLSKDFKSDKNIKFEDVTFGLTEEVSGSQTYDSQKIDSSLGHLEDAKRGNITDLLSLSDIAGTSNGYLQKIYEDDFKDKFPSGFDAENIILLLSTNGAAYTAKLPTLTLEKNERILVSFFVKTSAIRSGKTGASAILVDGDNKTTISAFDSTTVATVDIDSDDPELSDIYKGWVQCFFFVQNETDEAKDFHIELTYGPTAIASTAKTDYSDGYAAFANFQIGDLSKTQYGYAATGTYAQKVSLTASVKDSSKFADAAANGTQLENGLATPVGYTGVIAGSNVLVDGGVKNPSREQIAVENGIYTGLLSSEYADKYLALEDTADSINPDYFPNKWVNTLTAAADGATDSKTWWKNIFGNEQKVADMAYQPLVIVNTSETEQPSYGFFAKSTSVSANATSRISMRVKLSAGAVAYIYLVDVSDVNVHDKSLQPTLPAVTYWYDDDGNLVSMDPSADDYEKNGKILFTLEENGLYKNAQDESDTKYYANLSAFGEPNDEGNLVTSDNSIAYYGDGSGKFYAYYDKDTEKYSQEVNDFGSLVPEESKRYTAPANLNDYASVIRVEGDGSDTWTTVSFYVQTGSESKSYRLELWAGQRDYVNAEESDGIPAGGYVFFDRASTTSVSNYSTLRNAAEEALKDELGLKDDENLPAVHPTTNKPLALYYTFTFFDSPNYLRYDATTDEDNAGNPWGSYEQSSYSEVLSWLYVENDGELLGTAYPTVSLFMSYAQNEVEVTPDPTNSNDDSSNNNSSSSNTTGGDSDTNIWLLLSSIILAAALLFAVGAVITRRLVKKYGKKTVKVKSKQTKRVAPKAEKEEAPAEEPAPAPAKKPEAPVDENDPYNE